MVENTRRDEEETDTITRPISRGGLLKKGAVAVGALAGVGLLGHPEIALGAPVRQKRYKIALVPKALSIPVFNVGNWGGQTRALELGDVDFRYTGPATLDSARQVQIVDSLINAGYDAISISCVSPQDMLEPINRAVAKGIKVMTFDSDSPQSKRPVFYGVDSFKAGQTQGRLLNTYLKGKGGDVWLLSGGPAAQNLNARIQGVKSVLAKNLRVAGTSFCNDDTATSVTQVEDVLRSHPSLVGYVMIGAWPLFTDEGATPLLAQRAKAGLQVISFDYLAQELPFVAHGTVKALVGQDFWGWGYQSVTILHGLLTGKHFPAFVPGASPVVTSENLADYQNKWKVATGRAGAAKVFKEAPVSAT